MGELAARVMSCCLPLSLIGATPLVRDFCVPAGKPGSFALFVLNLSAGWAFWPVPPCSFMFSSFFQSGNVWVITVTGYFLPDAFGFFFFSYRQHLVCVFTTVHFSKSVCEFCYFCFFVSVPNNLNLKSSLHFTEMLFNSDFPIINQNVRCISSHLIYCLFCGS